ncbi:hypothetical protein [Bradyrhizobium sp. 87]|uniref:hypothetical protein n=1 Tax=Bradyrhizobium sp. 87 TaxID=2782682 RepID=UPI001FF8B079|nr:hypothetical protein [Bradyrhizobium sp. 87]
MRCKNDSIVGCLFPATPQRNSLYGPVPFFLHSGLITMHPIQGTHIAAIFKLATQQLEALRIAPEFQKEYSEILVLREKIKLVTDLKQARRQLLTRCLPRASGK